MDIGDGNNERFGLRLHYVDGSIADVSVPHAQGGLASDRVFFLGVVTDRVFDRVAFVNDGTEFDFAPPVLAFDDIAAGTRAAALVPEPASWVLMLCGIGVCLLAAHSRRKRVGVTQLPVHPSAS